MKYLSVFLAILFIWFSVILLSAKISDNHTVFNLYRNTLILTVLLFFIGFWRNK